MSTTRRETRRRAITLLELLLVLVLLAVIGSLATPAIFGSFSSVRLRRAGDLVLTSWSQARARAIETGQVHEFRYERETGNYRVQPQGYVKGEPPTSGNALAGGTPTGSRESERPAAAQGETASDRVEFMRLRTLPDEIEFHSGQFAAEQDEQPQSRTNDAWSQPILFFPDGAATTASVVLVNPRTQFVRLTLRGLTGIGRGSDVLSRNELDRITAER